jgi:hypothetical protein
MLGGPELCKTASWWEHDNKQPGSRQQEMYLAEQDSVFQPES